MAAAPLVITGAGGFARETVGLIAAINAVEPTWDLLGLLDDNRELWGTARAGVEIIGGTDWLESHDVRTVVCVGNPSDIASRQRLVERLGLPDDRFATLVHPMAVLAGATSIGVGTVVHALCVATADVTIGRHVALMPSIVMTHDNVIGDFATIGAGALLAGNTVIGVGAYIGSGARIREQMSIGAGSLVGMGSIVTRSVPAGEVWVGAPARFLRSID